MDVASLSLFQWFIVFWKLPGFQMTEKETIYVSTGSDVKIKCPYENVHIWQYLESKDVLALCENGENRINPKCNVSDRINISSDCQLEIQNFTTDDLNIYICKTNNYESTEIHVRLRNIRIDEAIEQGSIHAIEGEKLTLTCTVNWFFPGDTLSWIKDTELLASGNTSSLNLTLQVHRSYEKSSFICIGNNSNHTRPLIARVQLNVLLKPAVSIIVFINSSVGKKQKIVIVRQGQYMELKCRDNSNASGDVQIFSWLFNGNMIRNNRNRVVVNKTKAESAGQYTCMASNKAGNDSDIVNITVAYSPIVWSKMITFNESNRPRSIECEVSGEPNTYNFSWSHYTNNNQLVRKFNSSTDRKLILPDGDANDLLYEDSGVYVCNVTNGITDESGKLWQKGEIKVIVEGKPVLAKPQRSFYFGNFNGTSSISLFVLSSSNELKATWKNENGSTLEIDSCSSTVNQTLFNGKLLNIAGYQCVYQIQNTQEKDFQNYTVDLRNKNGIKTVDISLVSSRAPEVPEIFDVYQRHNDIVLKWKPKFDGGEPQSFIVQYRKNVDEIWKSVFIQPNETKNFVLISNLQPNTKYLLRMLAFNRIGNSSFTGLYTVLTDDDRKNVWIQFKFLFLSIAVLLPICLIVLLWRYKQARKTVSNNFPRRNSNPAQGVSIGNDFNVSSNRDDVYSSIDSRRQILDKQKVTYKVAGKSKGKNKSDCDKINQTQNRNRKHDSAKLNYIEIAFDPVQLKGKFYIHGNDNRTPYADIDFTAKVDPIISLDESDDSSSLNENNEDDFVSLEDVQQWNIHND